MAGVNENLNDRTIVEEMKRSLKTLFPGEKLTLKYIPRDSLLEMDEHRIVQGRFFFGGKIVLRYFGYAGYRAEDTRVQALLEKEFAHLNLKRM